MKKYIFLFIILLPLSLSAQKSYKIVQKVKSIHQPQNFFLNGGTRALIDGQSRTLVPVELPPNTVEWFYTFSTTADANSVKTQQTQLNLLAQLTKYFDPTGISATAVNTIFAPTGSESCDIYLFDKTNSDKFIDKKDKWGNPFTYKIEGSRTGLKSGVVQIRHYDKGIYYLGIKNPSALSSLFVTIEVVAVVEEKVEITKSEAEEKYEIYANLSKKAKNKLDYDQCLSFTRKALALDASHWDMHAQYGLMLLAVDKPEDALDSYINAISVLRKIGKPTAAYQTMLADLDTLDNEEAYVKNIDDIKDVIHAEMGK